MQTRHSWHAILAVLVLPASVSACEPIVPLAQLLSGSTLAGPAMLTQSAAWLAVAVALKCGAFAFLERRLTWRRAVLFMLFGNVISTVPGILIAAFTSSGTGFGILFALPIVAFLGWLVQCRLAQLPPSRRPPFVSGGFAALAFIGFFIVSAALFGLAGVALDGDKIAAYWLLKFLFVTLAAVVGIVLSAIMEECIVAWLSRKSVSQESFYTSVFRANYITLAAILLVAAMQILPQRLRSPHFITEWWHSVVTAVIG